MDIRDVYKNVFSAIEKIVEFVKNAHTRRTASIPEAIDAALSTRDKSSEKLPNSLYHPLLLSRESGQEFSDDDFFKNMKQQQAHHLGTHIETLHLFFNGLIYGGEMVVITDDGNKQVVKITDIFDKSFEKNKELWFWAQAWLQELEENAAAASWPAGGEHAAFNNHASSIAGRIRDIEMQKLKTAGVIADENALTRFEKGIESLYATIYFNPNNRLVKSTNYAYYVFTRKKPTTHSLLLAAPPNPQRLKTIIQILEKPLKDVRENNEIQEVDTQSESASDGTHEDVGGHYEIQEVDTDNKSASMTDSLLRHEISVA